MAEERVAVVTGAARGIGRAIAARLVTDGHRVAIVDIDAEAGERAAAELGPATRAFACDVADPDAVDRVMAAVLTELGRLDVLVNNAGITGKSQPLPAISNAEWRQVVGINLNGVFFCCRAAVPIMLDAGWGRIVNIASIAGKEGNPNMAAYSATKAAVIGLTKSLGKELASTPVRVNCVTPAVVATEMMTSATPEMLEYMVGRIPMGRVGQPEEVAALVSFLASDACSFSTGAVFDISGGRATY